MAWVVDADQTLRLAAAVANIALATFLVVVDRRSKANLVFSALLAALAVNMILRVSFDAARASGATESLQREIGGWSFAASLVAVPLGLYFLWVFPKPRGFMGSRRGTLLFGGIVLSILTAYLAKPTLLITFAMIDGRLTAVSWGPILLIAVFPVGGLLAAAFAHAARRAPDARSRRGLYLVSLGAAATSAAGVARGLGDIWYLVGGPADAALAGTIPGAAPIYAVLRIGNAVCIALALVWILRATRAEPETARANVVVYVSVLTAVALLGLVGFLLDVRAGSAPLAGRALSFERIRVGTTQLVLPLLATYALLRHRLFDLDVKIRWTVRASTIGAMFLGAFLVVSQLAQNYLSASFGWALGGLAAGLMFVAIHPIQRIAERVANAAVPNAKSASAMSHSERRHVYADAARGAWADGMMERAERAMLDRLRDTLGLSHEEAASIESEAANASPSRA